MKKICVIIIFVILFNSKAFGKNYNCSILGEAGKVELVKNGNIYKVIFDEKEFWNFKIYQESKELLELLRSSLDVDESNASSAICKIFSPR